MKKIERRTIVCAALAFMIAMITSNCTVKSCASMKRSVTGLITRAIAPAL